MRDRPSAPAVPNTFLEALSGRLGLGFAMDRFAVVERAIATKIRSGRFGSADAFLAALDVDQDLRHEVIETVVVPETHFFRHPQHFAFLRDEVLAGMVCTGRPLRLWSAGCSTGEEPYSLAILLHQMGLSGQAAICATDVCRPALEKARRGIYRSWSLRGIEEWPGALRFFERLATGEYRLARQIREMVAFREANLASLQPATPGNRLAHMDVVLCRNVLIYMSAEKTVEITRRLIEMLAPGGWLIPGPSDPLAGKCLGRPHITPNGIFYRRPDDERGAKARAKDTLGPLAAPAEGTPMRRPRGATPEQPAQDRAAAGSGRRTSKPATGRAAVPVVRDKAADGAASPQSEAPAQGHAGEVGELVNAGRLEEAWQLVTAMLEHEPLSPETHYLAAFVQWHRLLLDHALACLGNAVYLEPGCAVAYQMRGLILLQNGQRDLARRAFRTAYQLATRLPGDAAVGFGEGETAAQLARAAQSQIRSLQALGGRR